LNKWLRTCFETTTLVVAAFALGVAILSPVPAFAQSAVGVSAPDITAIVQPIFAVIGTVIAGLLAIYVPRAVATFEIRTRIQLTDQQRAMVLGAVRTAAGMIETALDQGAVRLGHVDVTNPAVRAEAVSAINAVPKAAAALNLTVDSMARMIVGAVDTKLHGVATVVVPAVVPSGLSR
jgi:hypothetical protein